MTTATPSYKGHRYPVEIINHCAVDQHGNVLDVLVQSRRNAVAAKRFFGKLLKGLR